MDITKAAIEKNRVTMVALLVVFIAGVGAYNSLSRAEDPGFIVRTAQVQTIFPGASPERVEQLVTDKLEKAIQEMPEIDFLTSTSKSGMSVIMVNILPTYTEMRPIWDNLRRKVDKVRSDLPDEVIGPTVNDEFGDVFGTIITLTGDGFSYAELKEIADQSRTELLHIREVAKVEIFGIQEERIFVEYNNARLAELGISPFQLSSILESRNIIIPGGQIYTSSEQIVLEPTGNFDSIEELKKTVIKLPQSDKVLYLGDLANIYRDYIDPPKSKVHYDGKPSLALAISLREGGNIIDLGEEVIKQVERFRESYPIGVEFDLVSFQPIHVDKKVSEFVGSLFQAIAIVLAIMLLFLGIRTGLVVASLIPMAMIMAILVMSFFNIGLDQMSLASLIIALGMLVDNAIVMSESIMVQMSEGKKAIPAAIDSANELKIPLLTSSLTTAAAFLPIFLAESNTGEYTAPLFKVVTITLICSWLLSLTMTPLFCVKFLKIKVSKAETSFNSRFYNKYRSLLLSLLKNRTYTVVAAVAVLILSIIGLGLVPQIFFPANDKAIFSVELDFPTGTPLSKTEASVEVLEKFFKDSLIADTLSDKHGILDWAAFIGSGAPRYLLAYSPEPPSPEYTYFIVNATNRNFILRELIPRIQKFCFETFPDITADVRLLSLGPPVEAPVQVRLSGSDENFLFSLADKIKKQLTELPAARDIKDDWGQKAKKIVVDINQPRAQRAGLTSRDIAFSLQTILSGIETTDYREEDEVIPITLRSVAADRKDIGKLESHNIYDQATGRSVPLKQVADIQLVWQASKILRRDRLKTITISSNLIEGANAIATTEELDRWLKEEAKSWPIGYKYEYGGEIESSGEANASIGEKFPIAVLLIVLLMVAQFNSIRKPLIIMLTIPLGIVGVTIGLLVTGSTFGFMTLLGIVSLVGIVINNAIVLIDRIEIEIKNGLEPSRAIIESAQRRLRPILLTTATTVGGLLPLWFSGGEMWKPMAISIIFGLSFATVLTLGLVPVLYSLFYKVSFKGFKY